MTEPSLTADPASPPPAQPAPASAPAVPPSKGSALWREIKGLAWVLLAVLLFHSFVAKPFYIPSESMMPGLLKGDRLVFAVAQEANQDDTFTFVLSFTPLRPDLVAEVAYERVDNGRFRHSARFQRWRTDRDAASCTFDQLEVVPPEELSAALAGSQ